MRSYNPVVFLEKQYLNPEQNGQTQTEAARQQYPLGRAIPI